MPVPGAIHRTVFFGEFTLDLDRGALLKASEDIKLRPKSFAMLCYLVERQGLLVTKDELLDAIWGDTVVTEDAVTHCVTDIRRALDDQSQEAVRTIPRRGYIFDVPVTKDASRVASQEILTYPVRRKLNFAAISILSLALIAVVIDQYIIPTYNARLGPRSVIVLPFSTNENEQAVLFADGLLGEILTQLYKIEALTTVGRATSMHYRDSDLPVGLIAQELGVAAAVSGNLIEAAGKLRFDIELLEARSGQILWVNSYELPHAVQGIFQVQSDIAIQIANALQAELAPGERQLIADKPATSEVAYDHYLRGEGYRQRTRLKEAISAYEQATQADPEFAAAWAALARSRALGSYMGIAPTTIIEAEFALAQARKLAPDAFDTILAEGTLLSLSNRFEEATAQLRRALELQPGAVEPLTELAATYAVQLRLDQARSLATRAVELDPMSIEATWQLAFNLSWSW